MALSKQITTVAIQNSNFANGNGTATDWDAGYSASTLYEIDAQNYDIQISPEFYAGNPHDKALSGKLRQNLRGYRQRVILSYGSSLQPTVIRNLFNDIITAFVTNNVDSITFHPDENAKANSFEVVLDQNQYNVAFDNTIANFIPSLTLIALDEVTSIPSYQEAP